MKFSLAPCVVFCFSVAALQAGTYSFQTINNPGDANFNQLLGINNTGTIAGYFGDGTVVPNNGYTWTKAMGFTAEHFPGSAQTQVVAINIMWESLHLMAPRFTTRPDFTWIPRE